MSKDFPNQAIDYLYAHRQLIVPIRKQTKSCVEGWFKGAAEYAIFGEKVPLSRVASAETAQVNLVDWADMDSPDSFSLQGQLAQHKGEPLLAVLDVDIHPVDGGDWTPARLRDAQIIKATLWEHWKRVLGLHDSQCFGRMSVDGLGHVIVTVEEPTKERLLQLARLTWKVPLRIGEFLVRVELLFCRDPAKPRYVTLPGSIHKPMPGFSEPDPVIWRRQLQADVRYQSELPPLSTTQLALALYGSLLELAALQMWADGSRHDAALVISGVLAREIQTVRDMDIEPIITEKAAEDIIESICANAGDKEVHDRLLCFRQAMTKDVSSEPLPGYVKLQDYLGEGGPKIVAQLRRLLAGQDYGPFEDAMDNVVVVKDGPGYLDLRLKRTAGTLPVYSRDGFLQLHENAPPLVINGKAIPLMKRVLMSQHRREVDITIELPGIEQGRVVYKAPSGIYLDAPLSEESLLALNLTPGWATQLPDVVNPRMVMLWKVMWEEQLELVTSGNQHHKDKINQFVAYSIQNPLDKPHIALVLSGGQGIGKSSIFTVFLAPILGQGVIKSTPAKGLFDGQFAFNAVPGCRFLVIEEADFNEGYTQEHRNNVKMLIREPELMINRKYGTISPVLNLAMPAFLTNSRNPQIAAPGEGDRAMYLIQGATQESLHLSREEWQQSVVMKRGEEVARAHERLVLSSDSWQLRQAAMHFFMSYPVTRQELTDITHSDALKAEYREEDLSPAGIVMQEILSRGYLAGTHADFDLTRPFPAARLAEGFNELWTKLGKRPVPANRVSRLVNEVFGEDIFADTMNSPRVFWFKHKPGTLADMFYRRTGARVIVNMGPEDKGENTPDKADIQKLTEDMKKGRGSRF